jgi:hypothetical protein
MSRSLLRVESHRHQNRVLRPLFGDPFPLRKASHLDVESVSIGAANGRLGTLGRDLNSIPRATAQPCAGNGARLPVG